MPTRRTFIHQTLTLGSGILLGAPLIGCSSVRLRSDGGPHLAAAGPAHKEAPAAVDKHTTISRVGTSKQEIPDLFDAGNLDLDFWVKPRTLALYRPATKEHVKVEYWRDGEVPDSAYQQICHILRDVQGKSTVEMDPKLLEVLWAAQAFIAQFGMRAPIEVLSGYRTEATNAHLREQGIPAARKSLHMQARAADIRIPNLDSGVLGKLVQSFRTGGVGFYHRPGAHGGWIHADTGLARSWKG